MYFAVSCYDKDNGLALRMATREKHLAFANDSGRIIIGGALLSADDKMIGSHLIVEADDRAALDVFLATDPYALAGLFEKVIVKPMKIAISNPL